MPMQTITNTTEIENTLHEIIQTLSLAEKQQVVNFARFLQWQTTQPAPQSTESVDEMTVEEASEAEILADEARWDEKLAKTPKTIQHLIAQAREEIRAGRTHDMIFTDDGRIVPG